MDETKVKAFDIKEALATKHWKEFFITECKTGASWFGPGFMKFDGLAIYKSWTRPNIRGYEVKVSRSDFLSDAKFYNYIPHCHEFYFVVPTGLLDRTEIPDDAGLMYYNPKTHGLITKKVAPYRKIEISSDMLMYIIMNRLDSERVPFFSNNGEFFKEWLERRTDNHNLAHQVKNRMTEEIKRLQTENDEAKRLIEKAEQRDEIIKTLNTLKIGDTWNDPIDRIKNFRSDKEPYEIKRMQQQLEDCLESLSKLKKIYKQEE